MPTTVIRNGRTYYEYAPHELEAHRLAVDTKEYIKRGRWSNQSTSVFDHTQTTNPAHRRGKRL